MSIDLRATLGATERLRDPIYGFIRLAKYEAKLIDLPIFQRLRRVHQLALTKYVYPSAEHSRFVHSLGVLEAASEIYEVLYEGEQRHGSENRHNDAEHIRNFKTMRIAALLHDIGHLPFSHAAEEHLLKNGEHEGLGEFIIKNDSNILEILNKENIDPAEVANLINKRSENLLLSRIISGEFDADRADYLLRDSHMCGIPYGIYDFKRYVSSFEINGNELFIKEDNIQSIESLITARYYYNKQVVHHRTRQAYDIALGNYIKEKNFPIIDLSNENGIDLEQFIWFDDYSILQAAKDDVAANKSVWAKYVLRLKHLKCFEQVQITHENRGYDEKLKEAISKADLKCFPKELSLRHAKLSHDPETKVEYLVKSRYGDARRNLFDGSIILKALSDPKNKDQFTRYFCAEEDYKAFEKIRDSVKGEYNG